jgi:acyl carrier protein
MELNDFIKNFINTFDETPTNVKVDGNTNFKDLEGWDSLTALGVMAMVDDEYGVDLTGTEIKESETIGNLFEIVKNKKR